MAEAGCISEPLVNRGDAPDGPTNGFGDFQVALAPGFQHLRLYWKTEIWQGDKVTVSLHPRSVYALQHPGLISAQLRQPVPEDLQRW